MRLSTTLRPLIAISFIAIVAAGCATDRKVIEQADEVHGSIDKAVIKDEVLANYLQEVGDRVIEQAAKLSADGKGPKKHFDGDNAWMFSEVMQFHFVNSKTMNAFTTGGEHMYIYTELFQNCKSEDELAAVVAHEFAHVYGKHVQKGMDNRIKVLAIAAGAAGAGAAIGGKDNWAEGAAIGGGLGLAGGSLLNMGFTRKDETEADKYGFRFYTRAGWDPDRFGDFFQSMIDKGLDKTPAIVSDHPTLKSRVEKAQEYAAALPPEAADWRRDPVAGAARFKDLQARAAKVGKNVPNDESLENSQKLLQALPRSCVSPVPEFDDQQRAQEELVQKARKKK